MQGGLARCWVKEKDHGIGIGVEEAGRGDDVWTEVVVVVMVMLEERAAESSATGKDVGLIDFLGR